MSPTLALILLEHAVTFSIIPFRTQCDIPGNPTDQPCESPLLWEGEPTTPWGKSGTHLCSLLPGGQAPSSLFNHFCHNWGPLSV